MKILITGGSGLIGRAFIETFSEYHFTVLSRTVDKAMGLLPANVVVIETLSELQNLDHFDAVINLAGEPIIDKRWSNRQKQRICQSRWQITRQLVDLFKCSQEPPQVFLSGSAIGAYGPGGDRTLTEDTAVHRQDFPTRVCLEWEQIATEAQPYTRVLLLRTGIVLSAEGGALSKMLLPFKLGLGGRLGSGQQYMSWIHRHDHIQAINHLIHQKDIAGVVNLVAPEPVRNIEFTRTLAAALGRFAIFPLPAVVLKILLGESSCLLLDSQKVIPEVLLNSGFSFAFPTLEAALSDLLHTDQNKGKV